MSTSYYRCGDCDEVTRGADAIVKQISYLRGVSYSRLVRAKRTGVFCEACGQARVRELLRAYGKKRRPTRDNAAEDEGDEQ